MRELTILRPRFCVDTVTLADGYLCCIGGTSPTLTDPRMTNNRMQFTVIGATGSPYAVVSSTDPRTPLSNWVPLITNTAPFTFVDSNSAAIPARYYRAVIP